MVFSAHACSLVKVGVFNVHQLLLYLPPPPPPQQDWRDIATCT
jgi:hypothetical protein